MGRIKDALNHFLERLAKANQEEFGGKKLDCCTLNKPSSDKKENDLK